MAALPSRRCRTFSVPDGATIARVRTLAPSGRSDVRRSLDGAVDRRARVHGRPAGLRRQGVAQQVRRAGSSRPSCSRVRWRHVWPVPLVLTLVHRRRQPADAGARPRLGMVERRSAATATRCSVRPNPRPAPCGSGLVPLVFVALLIPALPLFAHAEERIFRTGRRALERTRGARSKIVQFGLVHALIGIPIGAALALSIGGAYFMCVYLRAVRPNRLVQRRDPRVDHRAHRLQQCHHRCRGRRGHPHPVRRCGRRMIEPVDIDIDRDRSVTITFDDGMVCVVPGRRIARRDARAPRVAACASAARVGVATRPGQPDDDHASCTPS